MLVSLQEVLKHGLNKGIAIPAINTPNFETLTAAIKVAEEYNTPIIIAHAQLHESVISIETIGPVMLLMAKAAKVPVCVHLDHGESFEFCKKAIDLGFTGVMIDASRLPYEENVATTKKVVEYAHARGVGVEAELGCLPNRESGGKVEGDPTKLYTDPNMVVDFVGKTNVDALAIAFGTAHGIYAVKPVLSIDVIKNVRKVCNLPLVMHGGSGLTKEDVVNAINAGITKINFYTYMSYLGYAAAKKLAEEQPEGYFHDMCTAAHNAEYEKLKEVIAVFIGLDR